MTITRFTPGLFLVILVASLLGGLAAVGVAAWSESAISVHGYIAIFLGTFFTALVAFSVGVTMHIGQLRQEAEEARRAQKSADPPP